MRSVSLRSLIVGLLLLLWAIYSLAALSML